MTCTRCDGWGCTACELERVTRQRDALGERLGLVSMERDALLAELERIRSGKEAAAQWDAHAAAFHRAECAVIDEHLTPAETPSAKAVEAALRGLGPVTEGEP